MVADAIKYNRLVEVVFVGLVGAVVCLCFDVYKVAYVLRVRVNVLALTHTRNNYTYTTYSPRNRWGSSHADK